MNSQAHPRKFSQGAGSLKYHYIALVGLLGIAGGYQALVARDIFRGVLHPDRVYETPFGASSGRITDPGDGARVGLRKGDLLLAVEGVPYTGAHVLDEAVAKPHPDGKLAVTVRSPEGPSPGAEHTLQIPLTTFLAGGDNARSVIAFQVILYVVTPWFCLILGFWVAAVRPRDPLAWLLLGLMLSFTQIVGFGSGAWGPGTRDVARLYHLLAGNFWSIAMMLFGLYFPEPFPNKDRPLWKWLKWGLIALMVVCSLPEVLVKTIDVENYAAVEWLSRREGPFDTASSLLSFVAVSIFFISISIKGRLAVSRDAKRRLRLLYLGCTISLAPVFVVFVVSVVKGEGGEIGRIVPEWLLFTVLLLLVLFPLTLAYTIVVQRAMDVRVVVRQGLQYALAASGVRVLQVIISGCILTAAFYMATRPDLRRPAQIQLVCWGFVIVLLLRRAARHARGWVDRRFFRDAYNAEQILSELGEKVRSIVETQPLLATVAHRIAESLHVPRVAALIDGSGPYRPAYALGYPEPPQVLFPESAASVRQLAEAREPARVYLDDPDSWLYRRPDASDQDRQQLAELGSELLLPLAVRDHLLGFISLGPKQSEAPYTSSDLRLLNSVALQTGLALENARLTAAVAREVAQRERLNREVEIAREVQQRLFPQKLLPIDGIDYSGACRPALGVGGDYYDFLALPDGYLGVALGDVSGKGIAAALMMATLQASVRGEAMRWSGDLSQMMSGVNRLVFEASTSNRYATFFYAEYEPGGRTLSYVNAGHNPPVLLRMNADGHQVLRLEAGGTVIGLLESFPFQQSNVTLQPGDMLVLYSDGVSEAMNPADEEWGEVRMIETVERCQGLSAAQTIEYVMAGADTFASGAPQHDDMTLVVLRVLALPQ
jgi:sigma-B regulation protein RsbU (phosphoserine phosphatase)